MSDFEAQVQGVLAEVHGERVRQEAKWGEQNHPDGTGDGAAFLRGSAVPKPHERVAVTMGTLAFAARGVTDGAASRGEVTWADILLEEVFEALAEDDPARVRAELVQVAAVAAQWVSAIDRRTKMRGTDISVEAMDEDRVMGNQA